MELFDHLLQVYELADRTANTLGVPYADPFNEEATISSVADPLQQGRVKVIFNRDNLESDWMFVNGSGAGQLSSQYIGARCAITKLRGNAAAGIVSAIYSGGPDQGSIGNPIQIPVVSEQLASKSTDPGLQCNEANKGRTYIIANEFGQDLVICLRRNSLQRDGADKPSWAWKSLTHSEWIEKGLDPGAAADPNTSKQFLSNPGIPKCTKDLAGEIHEFSEDRAFRSFHITCRRDENGNYGWVPLSATPTFVRTTLPNCTEPLHGMNAILDTGRESEFIVCGRYAGKMLWLKQGSRSPFQFFDQDVPPSKAQWVSGIKPIAKLNPSLNSKSFAKGFEDLIMMEAMMAISPTGTDPYLKYLLMAANALPGTFDSAQTWSNIAKTLIVNKGTIPTESLVTQLSAALVDGGEMTPELASTLSKLGGIADVIVSGVKTGNTKGALEEIGKRALGEAINSFSPGLASVYYGYTIGGSLGAIDAAVSVGLDVLPDTLGQIMSPIAAIGQRAFAGQPIGFSTIFDAAVNGGLVQAVASILEGNADFANFNFDGLLGPLADGQLGSVSQILSDFNSIAGFSSIGFSNIPLTATTALEVAGGLGLAFSGFLGNGGLGANLASAFLGVSAVQGLVSGVSGLFKGGSGCPCSTNPSCRKTSHAKDSEDENLLEKCGNNYAGRPFYPNDPLNTGTNPIAEVKKIASTYLGEDLVGSVLDLTDIIKSNPKINNIAETVHTSRYADAPEQFMELAHSFDTVKIALQAADNNITKGESIDRKLIDSVHNMLGSLVHTGELGKDKNLGAVSELLRIVQSNSKAIRDLHAMAQDLNNKKDGGKAKTAPTPAITKTITNIAKLTDLVVGTTAAAKKILAKGIKPADAEWRSLKPGLVDLAGVVLGDFSPDLPMPFASGDMKPVFNKDRVLKESLSAQLSGVNPQNDITPRLSKDVVNEIGNETLSDIIKDIANNNKGNPTC